MPRPRCQCPKCKAHLLRDTRDSDDSDDDDGVPGERAAPGGDGGAGASEQAAATTPGDGANASAPSAGPGPAGKPAAAQHWAAAVDAAEARAAQKHQNRVSLEEANKLIRAELRGKYGVGEVHQACKLGWVRDAGEPPAGSCLSRIQQPDSDRAAGFLAKNSAPALLRALRELLAARACGRGRGW
jgi:hypothetical protein